MHCAEMMAWAKEKARGWVDEAADPRAGEVWPGQEGKGCRDASGQQARLFVSAKVVLSFHFLPSHLLSLQPQPSGQCVTSDVRQSARGQI